MGRGENLDGLEETIENINFISTPPPNNQCKICKWTYLFYLLVILLVIGLLVAFFLFVWAAVHEP
jgi:hypothetical protein